MYFFYWDGGGGVLKIKLNFLGGLPNANFCKRGGRGGQKTGKNANVICERSPMKTSDAPFFSGLESVITLSGHSNLIIGLISHKDPSKIS